MDEVSEVKGSENVKFDEKKLMMTFRDERFEIKSKILFPSFLCDYDELLKKDTPYAFKFIRCEQEQAILGEFIDKNLVIYNLLHFLDALIDVIS